MARTLTTSRNSKKSTVRAGQAIDLVETARSVLPEEMDMARMSPRVGRDNNYLRSQSRIRFRIRDGSSGVGAHVRILNSSFYVSMMLMMVYLSLAVDQRRTSSRKRNRKKNPSIRPGRRRRCSRRNKIPVSLRHRGRRLYSDLCLLYATLLRRQLCTSDAQCLCAHDPDPRSLVLCDTTFTRS